MQKYVKGGERKEDKGKKMDVKEAKVRYSVSKREQMAEEKIIQKKKKLRDRSKENKERGSEGDRVVGWVRE